MNTAFQTTLRAACFFLCGALTLGTLQAAARVADDSPPTKRVSYADLDISKPAGAKVLYSRIVSAANRVCAIDGYRDMGAMQQVRICIDRAIDNAVKDVDSPALSALRPSSVYHFASN